MNLGRAVFHELEPKLAAAAAAGSKGIEAFYEDTKIPAGRETIANGGTTSLQPFKNYDGLLSQERRDEKLAKLKNWFKMAKIPGADTIQIPSMFHQDPAVATGDRNKIVADLIGVADLGAKENPLIRFAYEVGRTCRYMQATWEITKKVDRLNFEICLDTYQILANVYADATSESRVRPNADKLLQADIDELLHEVPLDKVHYIQLANAARISPPSSPAHEWYDPKQKYTMTWSRDARLFPFEEDRGGYLPVLKMLETWVIDWGYRGWVSMELFDRSMMDLDPSVPAVHAQRGVASWKKCIKALKLDERAA